MSVVEITQAQHTESSDILTLIRELAEYEELSHEVVADEDKIRETLFGAKPRAEVFIARVDQKLAGFALYFYNYSTFLGKPGVYLEDLFVRPAFRGQGIGKKLIRMVAQVAVSHGCGRMEWSVLDWNQPAIEFYKSLGAQPRDGWTVYRLTGDALLRLGSKN